jgi:MinD-like ATPase involved in chromosome partitioning or flagellar assembly
MPASAPTPAPAPTPEPARRPTITVVHAGEQAPPAVERALAGPSGQRGDIRSGRVSVVPGGQRPGKPDQLQRDRARARQPLGRPRRIVVLGCTVGAGQTVTTLVTGEVLASLRSDEVAVLDLNPGMGGLSQRARVRPALSQAASLAHSRLVVLESGQPADDLDGYDDLGGVDGRDGYGDEDNDPAANARAFADASARHQLVLADPSTASVPRLLALTDLLVLVAPASAAAVSAIGMTFEWLDAHGQAGLAAESIMVLNGVSRRSAAHVEQAERVCAGRCRAIVRVPWDETLKDRQQKRAVQPAPGSPVLQRWAGLLSPATIGAYTALAGLIVAVLAEAPERARTPVDPPAAQSRGVGR